MSPLLRFRPREEQVFRETGPLSPAVLRALQFNVARRIDGLLAGDFRAVLPGPGTELAQVRAYVPGDDVRDIEWNVTARTGEPHVRVHIAEKVLTAWVLLDVSPSMTFGTADRSKAEVAEGVVLAAAHLAMRRGNRLGALTFGETKPRLITPVQGRMAVMGLLLALRGRVSAGETRATSLSAALRRARVVCRGRSLLVVVSDLRGPRDWRRDLTQLATRHDVIVVEVRDPREEALADVGEVWFVDPETGKQLRVDTSSAVIRERFRTAAADERAEVARDVRAAGADHVVLSTEGEWLQTFAEFLTSRKTRR